MRIGIFGGTFAPPHNGHLILAAEMCFQMQLDRLLWVLTPEPPHKLKQPVSPMEIRRELVQAAIDGDAAFCLSTVEIDRAGPHYSVDTVKILSAQHPGDGLFFMIGGDSLRDLPTWYEPQQLVDLCEGFGVMRRPEDDIDLKSLEVELPGIGSKVHFIQAPLLQISSTDIRNRIASRSHFRYYLPEAVYRLIIRNHWYNA
jgi:nicotinate-nucleotide adenylyltransferase